MPYGAEFHSVVVVWGRLAKTVAALVEQTVMDAVDGGGEQILDGARARLPDRRIDVQLDQAAVGRQVACTMPAADLPIVCVDDSLRDAPEFACRVTGSARRRIEA